MKYSKELREMISAGINTCCGRSQAGIPRVQPLPRIICSAGFTYLRDIVCQHSRGNEQLSVLSLCIQISAVFSKPKLVGKLQRAAVWPHRRVITVITRLGFLRPILDRFQDFIEHSTLKRAAICERCKRKSALDMSVA